MQNYNSEQGGFGGILLGSVKMKALSILILFVLIGCAPSTQDLIQQAHLTGDWTLVNQRVAAMERREAQRSQPCPRGGVKICNSRFGDNKCTCASNAEVRRMLDSLRY